MKTNEFVANYINEHGFGHFGDLSKEEIFSMMDEYRNQGRNFTEDEIRIIQEQHYDAGYEAGRQSNNDTIYAESP